ncbi:MAG: replication initiation protein [Dehalococcoidia bacterium]|nr:replication initiation protein [Dehalococcoidia bacterium]
MARIKKKPLLASQIVTQANELVESRYNLTLGEQRLIFTMIARIQPEDEDFKPYRISLNELAEFLGINKNHIYADCKKITKKLLEKVVEIKETGRLLQTHWVSSADYVDGTGTVNLTFDPLLKPYLLQLKGNFTSSKLEMLLSFKSQYTMRMYTLLKQYERLHKREIELQQLRNTLGLGNDQYKLYSNFRERILEPTQKELKSQADLYFEFDEIKYGRKVGAIRFRIFTKNFIESLPDDALIPSSHILPSPEANTNSQLDQLMLLIPEQHKTKKTVQAALEAFKKKQGFDYVKRNILYSNAKANKSYAGFLNNALKEDWGHDWELTQQEPLSPTVKKKIIEVWEQNGFSSRAEYDKFMWKKQMTEHGYENLIPAGY